MCVCVRAWRVVSYFTGAALCVFSLFFFYLHTSLKVRSLNFLICITRMITFHTLAVRLFVGKCMSVEFRSDNQIIESLICGRISILSSAGDHIGLRSSS